MQIRKTGEGQEEPGPAELRHALLRAFARPSGSVDLPLHGLAILLVAVQQPGRDLGALAAATGLDMAAVRQGVDRLRRLGLVTAQAGVKPLAISASPRGLDLVMAMASGLRDAPAPQPPSVRKPGQVVVGVWPRSGEV